MVQRADTFDLAGLRLSPGDGRRFDLDVALGPLRFSGQDYAVDPRLVPVRLDVSCTTGPGWALRLRLEATLAGPCMRCLQDARPAVAVDAQEVDQPGGGDQLTSPYLTDGVLALADWARDALALALPARVLCRPDCAGLCAECGADLNEAGPEHHHEPEPDPRWAALRELRLE